jgi:thymidylate synthase
MNNLDKDYQNLLHDIITNGVVKEDRTGTGTLSVFGRQIRHNMITGFPLLTTKKMAWKTMVTELLWFLQGDTNIKYLVDNGCNIWTGDALKNYEKHNGEINWGPFTTKEEAFTEKIKTDDAFAKIWGELGPIYGKQWREWKTEVAVPTTLRIDDGDDIEPLYVKGTQYTDQIQKLVLDIMNNPDSRRLMVSAWNVGELDQMVLPPCHYGFQVYTQKLNEPARFTWYKNNIDSDAFPHDRISDEMDAANVPTVGLSLMWNQRSVDTFLGLPFNIASYGLLLHILAHDTNTIPHHLIGNLGDTHLYLNHLYQAREQVGREPFALPQLRIHDEEADFMIIDNPGFFTPSNFKIINYQSHPAIKAPLSN